MVFFISLLQENPATAVPNDAPKWVSQWAALTNQKARKNSSGDMELSSPGSSISDGRFDAFNHDCVTADLDNNMISGNWMARQF